MQTGLLFSLWLTSSSHISTSSINLRSTICPTNCSSQRLTPSLLLSVKILDWDKCTCSKALRSPSLRLVLPVAYVLPLECFNSGSHPCSHQYGGLRNKAKRANCVEYQCTQSANSKCPLIVVQILLCVQPCNTDERVR